MEPQEIEDEEHEQILERVAAVDVAKVSGLVCTRVPHNARPGKRWTRVWQVDATGSWPAPGCPAPPARLTLGVGGPGAEGNSQVPVTWSTRSMVIRSPSTK